METRRPRRARLDQSKDSVMITVTTPAETGDQEFEVRWLRRDQLFEEAERVAKPNHSSADGYQIPYSVRHEGREIVFHLSRQSFLSLVEAVKSEDPVSKVEEWNSLYGA